MGVSEELLRGIYGHGFETPSQIQQKGVLPILAGRDLIAPAQSGTGKTATFSIGLLSTLDLRNPGTQAIIMAAARLASYSRWRS